MWKYYEIYCVSITIYADSYKYLKEKKVQTKKEKKKRCSYSAIWTNQNDTGVIVQNLGNKMAHCTKRGIVEALPLFIWLVDVGKFRPWLIELTNFKPKFLIRFIMNKTC